MAKVIARTGIKRDSKHLYYVKGGAVWQAPRKGSSGKRKIVAKWGSPSDMDYSRNIYFVDKAGNVACAPRKSSKGRRKKTSKGGRRRSRGRKK